MLVRRPSKSVRPYDNINSNYEDKKHYKCFCRCFHGHIPYPSNTIIVCIKLFIWRVFITYAFSNSQSSESDNICSAGYDIIGRRFSDHCNNNAENTFDQENCAIR